MALNKETLKADIIAAFLAVQNDTDNATDSLNKVADKIAIAVDNYVRSAQIVYTSGLTAPNGAVIGNFNGKLQ